MMKLKLFSKNSTSHQSQGRRFWQVLKFFGIAILACTCIGLEGCTSKKIAIARPVPTDLQKAFELKCHKEYGLNVITRLVGKTFWIYAPTDKPLLDFAADTAAPPDPLKKIPKYDLLYIDGNYKDNMFNFEYDVLPKIKSDAQNNGITEKGTDTYNKMYNDLVTAITETLVDANKTISFVVISMTDIKRGIEVRYTFYLEDYRMATADAIPYEEFNKRVLQESKGSTDFIGDEIGQHLEYDDIRMPNFLAKQIVNRIRFKFTQSDFPPQKNYEETIIDTIADTLRYYTFTDFKEIHTNDIRSKKKMIFTPLQLSFFGEDKANKTLPPPTDGKLVHIIFENGQETVKDQ